MKSRKSSDREELVLIRVLVVDDSILMRSIIGDMLNVPGEISVVGVAKNGLEAIAKTKELKPDVITMDVEMPRMDGITALRQIMKEQPTPVIMLSAVTKEGTWQAIMAMSAGAVDFVPKPSGSISLDIESVKGTLIEKIRMACNVGRSKLQSHVELPDLQKSPSRSAARAKKVVIIGSSTGGPSALEQVVPKLPENIKAGILIVQHMPPGFTRSLAERLNRVSPVEVKEAQDGDAIIEGRALLAPGDYHMIVRKCAGPGYIVSMSQEPPVHRVRPAVDVTMKSAVHAYGSEIVGVVLTGMGTDGAFGLKDIKDMGGRTIACDEKTSVIFGMPKAAIELGCVDRVEPLGGIADAIVDMI
jgi:Chemotaxis response regulator containing a CheY-like receiver domain and a methylesterase domain